MADQEAPKQSETLQAGETPEASVGVLGWLGFIIINSAAWGIITTASWISWIFGFNICLVYTVALVGLAVWLQRRGQKYRQFVNLLWVLAVGFVFILGIYISVQVIGKIDDDSEDIFDGGRTGFDVPLKPSSNDLAPLLPSTASQELKTWANADSGVAGRSPTFAIFSGGTFFTGFDGNSTKGQSHLWHVVESSASKVTPDLMDAQSFVEFQSKLYFVASNASGQGVWCVGSNDLGSATSSIHLNDENGYPRIQHLFVDEATSKLYFKATYNLQCPNSGCSTWVDTVFSSNGAASGTVDLRGDLCANSSSWCGGGFDGGSSSSSGSAPTRASLWGVLFVATLPMLMLAGFVLVKQQMPGLIVNVFGGILCAVITIYLIANYGDDMVHLNPFLKWFITIYTSVLWVVLVAWSLRTVNLAPWLEELKTWAVAVVGVSFFVIVHIDLEIPFTVEAWRWVVYALVALVQMVISAAVSRTVPMVAGAIGVFVVAWKIAYEIVEFADFGGGEFKMLAMLGILGLQGIGIIVGAIFYGSKRTEIDDMVRAALTCGKSRVSP